VRLLESEGEDKVDQMLDEGLKHGPFKRGNDFVVVCVGGPLVSCPTRWLGLHHLDRKFPFVGSYIVSV
jgi:hypothetical protein